MAQGFVIIELVVTMVIIGLLAGMLTIGLPAWRESKALALTEQLVSSQLREASQRALQEARANDCVTQAANDPDIIRRCSDIGVALRDTKLIMFADTNNADKKYTTGDFKLAEQDAPPGVHFDNDHDFLFDAVPPTITLFIDGRVSRGQVVAHDGNSTITLNVDGYGIVTRQ